LVTDVCFTYGMALVTDYNYNVVALDQIWKHFKHLSVCQLN